MTATFGKVRQHYDDVAGMYDDRYDRARGKRYYAHISDRVREDIPRKGRILDLGCGTGLFLRDYEDEGGEGIGIDLSREMVRRARCRCGRSGFVVGNAEVLPFRDGVFDAVCSLMAFSYVPNPAFFLSEAFRVLAPGGKLSICTLGRNLLTSGLPAIYSMAELMRIRKIGMGDFGERYYSREEMTGLLQAAGFTDIDVRKCSFAHLTLADPFFSIARMFEPFVEEKVPRLAYNLLARAERPL